MMGGRTGVAVLGSTGSIGTQTLDVIAGQPERFQLIALAAGTNQALLAEQAHAFRPRLLALHEPARASEWNGGRLLTGEDGLIACATDPEVDIVVVATSGIASLRAVVAAIEAGKTIALANKESLVCAADVILPLAARRGVELRPVDSEHSAIWQCLQTFRRDDLVGLTLTASGGPFRSWSAAEMTRITPADALAHPTWSMGGKITVDSATLVNKGLEVIEAHHLFAVPYDALEVVIHPESIVHSLVEFADGSQLAQLSHPDMRLPIQYALTWPEHAPLPARRLSLPELGRLTFEAPDHERFPALRLCVDAGRAGRSYPAALSAADEVAVEAFLAGHLPFTGIPAVLEAVLSRHDAAPFRSLEDVEAVDSWARGAAEAIIHRLRG